MAFQEQCLQKVRELARDGGLTVLFVSHDMEAISRLCDRVLWLNAGQIVRIGDPESVVAEYQASAWATVNRGRKLRKGGGHTCPGGEILSVRLVAAGGKEIGAVRVEDEAWVEVAFRTAMPDLKVRAHIDVSARGITTFRSMQPAPVLVPGTADAVARVRIPPHLLAETTYSVTASLAFFAPDQPYTCILDNAMAFQVYDAARGDSARGTFKGQMPGVIAPRLDWRTEVVQPAPPAVVGSR
jgi:lipopolysaccharide transport system ATP-binding protein